MRVLVMASLLILSSASLAEAGRNRGSKGGRLSSVGSGLRSGSSGSSRSSSTGSRSSSSSSSSHHWKSDSRSSSHGHLDGWSAGMPNVNVSGDVYAGTQKLVDSDRAFSFEGRLLFNRIGVAARLTQFQERQDVMQPPLKLDLASVALTYRFRVSPRLALDPELGVAMLAFRGDGAPMLTEQGGVVGVGARYEVAKHVSLVGAARLFQMPGNASAIEGRIGIAAGPVQLSYRRVSFVDAGPPLEGPEAGIGFSF